MSNAHPATDAARTWARWRFAGALLLFVGWVGWLAYLALTVTRPIVLSRPQFLAAQLDVLATVRAGADGKPETAVKVERLLWPADAAEKRDEIRVINLATIPRADGWVGPGSYLLPLVKDGDDYRVPAIPYSPGLSSSHSRPRVYPATPETLAQERQIRQPGS